ncbi:MAG: DUF1722 domain-containing protein, partial [Myxococcales bacterium]
MTRVSEQARTGRAGESDDGIRVGVSMCLLGERVRYDGGHKRHRYVTEVLARYFHLVPICPEVELGMGIPRETLRLVRDGDEIRMLAPHSGTDHTRAMKRYAAARAREIARLDVRGYVFKSGSPSCGTERVRTYTPVGTPARSTSGLFATAVMERLPSLPVEEEGRLGDARLRESFVEKIFAYDRLRRLFAGRWSVRSLQRFQADETSLLMAHSPKAQRQLSRMAAAAADGGRAGLAEKYQQHFMTALARPVTHHGHFSVLQHLMRSFERSLTADEKAEIVEAIA